MRLRGRRGKIELNPLTAAITITTDPPGSPDSIPTSIEGIPLEIQHVNATTTRGNFQFNPTNCAKMSLTGTVQFSEGGTSTISTPFQVTNCAALKFEPKFSGLDVRENEPNERGEPEREAGLPERAAGHRRGHREGQSRTPQAAPEPPDDAAEGVHRRAVRSEPGRLPRGVEDRLRDRASPR